MKIEAKITQKSYWIQVAIVSVTEGFSQRLEGGKWVNTTTEPQRFEEEILRLGKCFSDDLEAEKFMKTKAFKSILKSVQKNWI